MLLRNFRVCGRVQVSRRQMVVANDRICSSATHSFQSKYVRLVPASFEGTNIDSVDG